MKRNILYLTLLTTGLLVSCSNDGGPAEPEGPVDATLTLSVFAGTRPTGTKAASTKADDQVIGNEAEINNLQIAVFKQDGSLLAAHYEDFTQKEGLKDTIGVSAKSGRYTLVVLANAGNVNYTKLSELKGETVKLSTQSSDNLTMSSKCMTVDIKAGENYIGPKDGFGGKEIPSDAYFLKEERIKVTRIAGRIDMELLSVDWSDDTSGDLKKEGAGFRLKKIYVRDAKEESRIISGSETSDLTAADWELVEWEGVPALHGNDQDENEAKYLPSLNLYPLSDGGDAIIEFGDTKKFSPLSCYVTENGNYPEQVPAPTRIIVVGDIIDSKGETILSDRHYTIKVNDGNSEITGGGISNFTYIRRNYVYHIYATITGKGSPDEESFSNSSITVLVQAVDWDVVYEKHPDVN